MFSRTLYGGRLSILIGLGSALGAAVIGVLLGCYGGYKGGLFDKIVLRLSEIFMSFPQLILVMMLGTIFGRGLWNLIFIFILTGWGGVYRQARAKMLSLREEEYVQSMRAFGLSDFCHRVQAHAAQRHRPRGGKPDTFPPPCSFWMRRP